MTFKTCMAVGVAVFAMSACPKSGACDNGTVENRVHCLQNLAREGSRGFAQLREHHGIYYSITSSPKRLSKLHHVLETLDLSVPKKVFVVLPLRYKNKELYDLEEIEKIRNYSHKIEILRPEDDLGPIMKLLPAVERVREEPGNPAHKTVVTFDDDTGYPAGLPEQLIKYSGQLGAVVAGRGQDATFFGVKNFPGTRSSCQNSDLSDCDIVEGFHGVAYPVARVDSEMMKAFSKKPGCKLADDFVISYVLAVHGVRRIQVKNRFTENLVQFPYGHEEDAAYKLHSNDEKYRQCFASMNAH